LQEAKAGLRLKVPRQEVLMDTHIATHPESEPGIAGMSAHLPDEADEPNGAPPGVGGLEPGERLPLSAPKPVRRRRGLLLAGVAVVAIAVAAGGAFLVSPYNKVYPVPRLQASVNGVAHDAQGPLRPILAPSASLARVSVPAPAPATRESYAPKPRDQEVAELLSLHPGSTDPAHADHPAGSSAAGHPVKPVAVHSTTAPTSVDADAPAGDVPREPGSSMVSQTPAATSPSPKPPVTANAAPAGATPKDATALIIASLPQAWPVAPDAPAAPQTTLVPAAVAVPQVTEPPTPSAAAPVVPPLPPQPDVLTVAANLRAGPMSQADQVQVLNLVTEMAAMVKDLRKQQAEMEKDLGKSSADVAARLTDYERRLALAEARSAVAAAADPTGSAPANVPVGPTSDPAAASLKVVPVVATQPIAVVPGPAGAPKVYRVQAASPGLALLAQVDRGGGDGAQMQVVVGDTIPDYGRVKSIGQKGTTWVVTTDHGAIQ
jgi:hypothetical protein